MFCQWLAISFSRKNRQYKLWAGTWDEMNQTESKKLKFENSNGLNWSALTGHRRETLKLVVATSLSGSWANFSLTGNQKMKLSCQWCNLCYSFKKCNPSKTVINVSFTKKSLFGGFACLKYHDKLRNNDTSNNLQKCLKKYNYSIVMPRKVLKTKIIF